MVAPPNPSGVASTPHPTPQYGQVVRTTGVEAQSVHAARLASVFA